MRIDLDPIAGGYIQQNPTPGGTTTPRFVWGMTGITDGVGFWTFTLTDEQCSIAGDELEVLCTGAPGSAVTGGVSFGLSQGAVNQVLVTISRNDTGIAADLPFYIRISKRRVLSWD